MMKIFTIALALASQTLIGSWLVEGDKDPFTDVTNCQITAMSTTNEGTLAVLAGAGTTDFGAAILFGNLLKSRQNLVNVKYRFDSDPPRNESWAIADNHKLVFSRHPEEFAARLRTASGLAVQAPGLSGNMRTLTFEFEKSTEAFDAFNACAEQ